MSDPDTAIAVTAPIGGRKRRLTTFKQLRTAIAQYDIERDSEVLVEDETGLSQTCRAGDHPVLRLLFEELLGPEPARIDPKAVAAAIADQPVKPAVTVVTRKPESPPSPPPSEPPLPQPPSASVVDAAGQLQHRPHDRLGPPSKAWWPWALGALAVLLVLRWLLSSGGSEVVSPNAASNASASSDAAVAASEAASDAFAAAVEPTPDTGSAASSSDSAAERDRQQQIALEKARVKERLAAEREARRRSSAAALPAPVIAPEPPPRVSLAQKARPRGNWGGRIAASYPSRALRDGVQGRVGVSVVIGPDGRVQSCAVSSSSGSAILDQAACEGMRKHARFDPALDDDGNPTDGSYSTAISYKLDE